MKKKERIDQILKLLEEHYPRAKTRLNYKTGFECIVAVALSARTTDAQVNKITPVLFEFYNNSRKMAAARPEDIEPLINRCGLYKTKSRNLVEMSRIIEARYHGNIPDNIDELLTLPGVGRKTANVVRSALFNQPAIAVDTHVFRVSRRLGLARGDSVEEVERELMDVIPEHLWSGTHHRLIAHGREICYSRKPLCADCFLKKICLKKYLKDS